MRQALRRLFLLALSSDAQALRADDGGWSTRCLHCRTWLHVAADGSALGNATLEHVVPQAWFGQRPAAMLSHAVGGDANDARNLAIACARCNHGKGTRHDARGSRDARAREVVAALLATRQARWRDPAFEAG